MQDGIMYVSQAVVPVEDAVKDFALVKAKREEQERNLGHLIAEKKGWKVSGEENLFVSRLQLYVFTQEELDKYVQDKVSQCANKNVNDKVNAVLNNVQEAIEEVIDDERL